MEFTKDDQERLEAILRWRRDVRHFQPDPIPEDLISWLEATMDLSPSVGNARPWRVIRVNDPNLRKRVRQDFIACNAAAAQIYDDERLKAYNALKLAGLDAAPLQLAVFTDVSPSEGHGLGRQTLPETLQQSTAMAVHTLWLSARAVNLGLGMVSILNAEVIEQIFDVPKSWQFTAYLCFGWSEKDDNTPLLHRTGWQENIPTKWAVR